MKSFLFSLLVTTSVFAAVPSFYLERDGVNYLCQATGVPDPGGSLACVDKAYAGPFSRDEAMHLCRGGYGTAPAECATKMYAGPFSKAESLRACSGALSIGPADCAAKLYAGPFSKEESLQVCGRLSTLAHADCALKSYAGTYTKSESIELCRSDIANTQRAVSAVSRQSPARSSVSPATKQMEIRTIQQIKALEIQALKLQRQLDVKR